MAKRSDEALMDLPETKTASNEAVQNELDALLREAHSLKSVEGRLKEVKKRIIKILHEEIFMAPESSFYGTRSRDKCVIVRWQNGKRSLDRALLVENGVSPEQIEQSMKQGEGYWLCELPEIGTE